VIAPCATGSSRNAIKCFQHGPYSTAHYSEGLVDLGRRLHLANLGTDHVSLIEEIARWDRKAASNPDVILCRMRWSPYTWPRLRARHPEGRRCWSMSMPARRMPAWRSRTCFAIACPYAVRGPRAAYAAWRTERLARTYVHSCRIPFDIASIVRPYVKWNIRCPQHRGEGGAARASAFAHSDPPGPVT